MCVWNPREECLCRWLLLGARMGMTASTEGPQNSEMISSRSLPLFPQAPLCRALPAPHGSLLGGRWDNLPSQEIQPLNISFNWILTSERREIVQLKIQ